MVKEEEQRMEDELNVYNQGISDHLNHVCADFDDSIGEEGSKDVTHLVTKFHYQI